MPPRPPYGMIRPDTERIVWEAIRAGERRDATWFALWPDVVDIVRSGDALGDVEAAWLDGYISAKGRPDLCGADVQTAQIPRDWAASVLSAGDRGAERAIRGLQDVGLLEKVHGGIRGHAALFAVMPLPEAEAPDEPP